MAECNETTSKTMMMMNMKAAMQIVRKSYTGNILFSSITIIEGIIISICELILKRIFEKTVMRTILLQAYFCY